MLVHAQGGETLGERWTRRAEVKASAEGRLGGQNAELESRVLCLGQGEHRLGGLVFSPRTRTGGLRVGQGWDAA